jgi:ABC-2 type transport system ATP-binding protein
MTMRQFGAGAIVQATGLGRTFGKVTAVAPLDFTVAPGEIFAVVGPDGAGKTTLVRMLCGVLTPTSGDAQVAGFSVRTDPESIKARIGYMPQRFSLFPDLTVLENLRFYAEVYQVDAATFATRSAELLADFELLGLESRLARSLSGGMKQKLALACTLLHDPDVLFLDEPTAGVDPISRRRFWRLLYQLNSRSKTIYVNTPYMDEAEHAGRVALMFRGGLIACDSPAGLKSAMGGEVLEISVADSGAARRSLRDLACITSLELFGARLHALVGSAQRSQPEVEERLARDGIAGARVRPVDPSLEDAFVALIAARERAA